MKIILLFMITLILSCKKQNATNNLIFKHFNLPSSNTHSPNSTWWGYHMIKVARNKDDLYFGIIENDTGNTADLALFKVYKINVNGDQTLVASHSTSRPGNLLVSSTGELHVLVFEPIDASINDSVGSLVHYRYANASVNNFNLSERIVVNAAPNAYQETVNIRLGATIDANDQIAVAYGLNFHQESSSKAMIVYTKKPGESWIQNIFTNLLHEYYYPFVILSDTNKIYVLPVQDDYVPGSPAYNRYYKIPFLYYDGSSWSQQMLLDLSTHALAQNDTIPQLVEQSEFFQRSNGTLAAILIDKSLGYDQFKFKLNTFNQSAVLTDSSELTWPAGKKIRWIRAFEIDSELYYIGNTSTSNTYIAKHSNNKFIKLEIQGMANAYFYLSSGRGGAHQNHSTLDILAVSGNSQDYPSPGMNLYVLSKNEIKSKLK